MFPSLEYLLDCYTVLACGTRTGRAVWEISPPPPQPPLAVFLTLWLPDLYVVPGTPHIRCIIGSRDQWGFLPVFLPHWQSPCTALKAVRLCKGTVTEAKYLSNHYSTEMFVVGSLYTKLVLVWIMMPPNRRQAIIWPNRNVHTFK